ncbi:MAG: hypothetical protein AAFR44_10765, partial [Pseudomonadota bacterium]
MSLGSAFFHHFATQGDALYARVLSRDDAQLVPARLTQAAAARLRAGIAALESWLRRVLILLALHLEPDLPAGRPYAKVHRPRRFVLRGPVFRIFPSGRELDIAARDAFRRWLAERYGDVSALNAAWGLLGNARLGGFAAAALPDTLPADRTTLADWLDFVTRLIPVHRAAHRFSVLLPAIPGETPDQMALRAGIA